MCACPGGTHISWHLAKCLWASLAVLTYFETSVPFLCGLPYWCWHRAAKLWLKITQSPSWLPWEPSVAVVVGNFYMQGENRGTTGKSQVSKLPVCYVTALASPQCETLICSVCSVCHTFAALRSGLIPGWSLPRRVRGTAASHDHPEGSLLGGKNRSFRYGGWNSSNQLNQMFNDV